MCCLPQGLVWFPGKESEVATASALLSLPCGWGREMTQRVHEVSRPDRRQRTGESRECKHGQQSLEKAEEASARA